MPDTEKYVNVHTYAFEDTYARLTEIGRRYLLRKQDVYNLALQYAALNPDFDAWVQSTIEAWKEHEK